MEKIYVTPAARGMSSMFIPIDKILYVYCDSTYRIQTMIKLVTGETIAVEQDVREIDRRLEAAKQTSTIGLHT